MITAISGLGRIGQDGHGGQSDEGIIAHGRDGFQGHVARALDGPFVVLLKQDGADEAGELARASPISGRDRLKNINSVSGKLGVRHIDPERSSMTVRFWGKGPHRFVGDFGT